MVTNAKLNLGSPKDTIREAVIQKDNNDGTIDVRISEGRGSYIKKVLYTSAWWGPDGQFIGGSPIQNSTVAITQNSAGQWYTLGFVKSDTSYNSFITSDHNLLSSLRNGRALIQVKNGNRIFLDPIDGIHIGDERNELHIDPNNKIFSHNFDQEIRATEASLDVNSVIRRDLGDNSTRAILGDLTSHSYDKSLHTIAMDPTASTSVKTSGGVIRNPALTEKRELIYEFAISNEYSNDTKEASIYLDPNSSIYEPRVNRHLLRANTLSLNHEYSNHLLETIKGTAVDSFGNILDINKDVIPIGKVKKLSLSESEDKEDAFKRIRELSRKSLAFHMELNTRKPLEQQSPPIDSIVDYNRASSNLFVSFDKEGQFKINVPASSEKGNIPLHVRHENFSNLISRTNSEIDPNSYVRADNNKEIYLASFANNSNITLVGDDVLAGFESPLDRITGNQIKYGTAHHDIIKNCIFFTKNSPRLPDTKQVDPYIHNDNRLNDTSVFDPYDSIVTDTITVYGDNANAGGRSGSINLDGFLSLNIGANTIDRQSLWLDCAGGIVSNIGRDKQGISYAASLDGDLLIQVGGAGIGNTKDSRFADQNDAVKNGVVDIRVIVNNGQQIIFRMSTNGIDIFSPGDINITSQQGINIKTNGTLNLEGTMIQLHAGSTKRVVQKYPATSL